MCGEIFVSKMHQPMKPSTQKATALPMMARQDRLAEGEAEFLGVGLLMIAFDRTLVGCSPEISIIFGESMAAVNRG